MLAADVLDALFVCTLRRITRHRRSRRSPAASRSTLRSRSRAADADGEAIVEAWERSGAVCAIGYQWRSLDVLDELRAILGDAKPGLLVSRSFGPTEGARRDLERGCDLVRRSGRQRRAAVRARQPRHRSPDRARRSGRVGASASEQRSARARRRAVERAGRRGLRASELRERGDRRRATSRGPPRRSRRSTPSTCRAPTPRCSWSSTPSSSCADALEALEVSTIGTVDPRVSSVTRFLDAVRSGIRPACPAAPRMRSPRCAPCSRASGRSRAASASPSSS